MIAYPLSLSYLPGKKIVAFIVLFTMLFNGGLVPTYMNYTTIIGIKKRFGKNAILKGMNFQEGATARERNEQVGGHKA